MGYLVAGNPLRDQGPEQDSFVDVKLDAKSKDEAIDIATKTALRYKLEYWELYQIVQVTGCDLTNGDWD